MVHQVIHNATVTLQLSFYLSVDERVEALRAAGIPVDETGNATAGYLFVRTTGRVGKRKNTYRWFAAGIGEEAQAGNIQPQPAWAEEQFAHADEIDIGADLVRCAGCAGCTGARARHRRVPAAVEGTGAALPRRGERPAQEADRLLPRPRACARRARSATEAGGCGGGEQVPCSGTGAERAFGFPALTRWRAAGQPAPGRLPFTALRARAAVPRFARRRPVAFRCATRPAAGRNCRRRRDPAVLRQ